MRQGETERPIAQAPAARGEGWDDRSASPAPASSGVLWRAWVRAVRAVSAARGPVARTLDGITLGFLGVLVRTHLVSTAPAGAQYESDLPAAARAAGGARLETELRLLLTAGAAIYVPLFVAI